MGTSEALTVSPEANSFRVGGEPRVGKSVRASPLVAALAPDPAVGLYGIDDKLVEPVPFEPVMRRLAWTHAEMCDLMDGLLEGAQGLRMAPAWWGCIVLIIDELVCHTQLGASDERQDDGSRSSTWRGRYPRSEASPGTESR